MSPVATRLHTNYPTYLDILPLQPDLTISETITHLTHQIAPDQTRGCLKISLQSYLWETEAPTCGEFQMLFISKMVDGPATVDKDNTHLNNHPPATKCGIPSLTPPIIKLFSMEVKVYTVCTFNCTPTTPIPLLYPLL